MFEIQNQNTKVTPEFAGTNFMLNFLRAHFIGKKLN